MYETKDVQDFIGMDGQNNTATDASSVDSASSQPGMKWYRFIIYFSLFAGMLVSLYEAYQALSGAMYSTDASELKQIYAYFDGLQASSMIFGVLFILTAAFAFLVRQRLAEFRRNAPQLFMAYLITSIVITIGFNAVISGIVEMSIWTSQSISSLVSSAIMVAVNFVYFNKRKHLFVK